jgi:hypothetical protein
MTRAFIVGVIIGIIVSGLTLLLLYWWDNQEPWE